MKTSKLVQPASNTHPTYGFYQPSEEEKLHRIVIPPNLPENLSMEIMDSPGVGYMVYDWIESHDPSMQPHLLEVIKNVEHVSFDRFMAELERSTSDMMRQLQEAYGEPFNTRLNAVVMVEGMKSNKWVAELAFHYLGFIPKAFFRLGEKDAWNFHAYVYRKSPDELRRLQEAFSNKTFFLFDDASLSGTQLSAHVQGICRVCKTFAFSIKAICVVVPFMTLSAENGITQVFLQNKPLGVEFLIAAHVGVKTLSDLSDSAVEMLNSAWYQGGTDLSSIGLKWFWHKIPNGQSFPRPLVRASVYNQSGQVAKNFSGVFIPKIIPPYKRDLGVSARGSSANFISSSG